LANKPKETRMCITCRHSGTKESMVRLVRTQEGTAVIDETGKMPGRGAYLCKNKNCIEKAAIQRRAERALSCRVGEELYRQLGEMYA